MNSYGTVHNTGGNLFMDIAQIYGHLRTLIGIWTTKSLASSIAHKLAVQLPQLPQVGFLLHCIKYFLQSACWRIGCCRDLDED